MTKTSLKDALGWGFLLWLIGYGLGIALFLAVPPALLGWIITPIGVVITLWVLLKRIHRDGTRYYWMLGLVWTALAVVLDYFFIVKALHPPDGYYKLDVFLYYALTLLLPPAAGWWKTRWRP